MTSFLFLFSIDPTTLFHSVYHIIPSCFMYFRKFLAFLKGREEREVVLVTHSAFLRVFLQQVIKVVPEEDGKWFSNCEMRSFIVRLDCEDDEVEREEEGDGEEKEN